MRTRIITGLALVAAVLSLIFLAPFWLIDIVATVVFALAGWELAKLLLGSAKTHQVILMIAVCWSLAISMASQQTFQPVFFLQLPTNAAIAIGIFVVLLLSFAFVVGHESHLSLEQGLVRTAKWLLFAIYLSVTFSFLFRIIQLAQRGIILWLLAATFLPDTLAYFSGKFLGKKKMSPQISPNKTWAGFCGALVGGALAVLLYFNQEIGFWPRSALSGLLSQNQIYLLLKLFLLGPLVAIFGVLGDLFESFLKRASGVKDSGTLIPGHGGILDRIDALLFTAPIVWLIFATI